MRYSSPEGGLPGGMEVIDGVLHDDGQPVREWIEERTVGADVEKMTWGNLLSHWDAIETDFAREYGLDLEDEIGVRTWRWFSVRVFRLLAEETLLARLLGLRDTAKKVP